jgi:hypothetical protein
MDVGHAVRHAMTAAEGRLVRVAVLAALLAGLLPGPAGAGAAAAQRGPKRSSEPPDPCLLLSDEDVRALQGHPVVQRVPSAPPARRFRIAQCVYRTPELTHAVSVAVASPLPAGPAGAVRAYWRERFSPAASPPGRHDPPRPVAGIGDDAFWVGDRVSGALYVLEGDVLVRVSVGGVREEGPRLERTKALAVRLVARLSDH